MYIIHENHAGDRIVASCQAAYQQYITFAFSFSACFSSVFAFQSAKNYDKQKKKLLSVCLSLHFATEQSKISEQAAKDVVFSYLGSDRLVIVSFCSASQCKFFPLCHAALFYSSVMMHHLSIYELSLFTSDCQRLAPLIEHARNLQLNSKIIAWTRIRN